MRITHLALHQWTVDHLQRLRKVRIDRPLALAGGLARRTAEGLQKIAVDVGTRQLDRPHPRGQTGILFVDAGHPAKGVEQLLGGEQSGAGMRKVHDVVLVQFVLAATQLVRATVGYRANDVPGIESMISEIVRQGVQQRRTRRRVRVAKIVHRLDNPAPQQVAPQPVDAGACEERVLRRRQPGDKRVAPILLCRQVNVAFERQPRLQLLTGSRLDDFTLSSAPNHQFLSPDLFALHALEECADAVVIVLRPALEGMVVALGALNADAQEQLRGHLGTVVRVGRRPIVAGRWIAERAAVGRQQRRANRS